MFPRTLLAACLAALAITGRADVPFEPPLYRAELRLEPSEVQLQTLPAFPARWLFTAAVADSLPRLLAGQGFSPALAAELAGRRRPVNGSTDVVLVPDRALLARFTPAERSAWHELLGRHPGNDTYRWPLSLGPAELAALDADPRWREALTRLRATALPLGDRLVFGDLFALEDAFASAQDRRDFYRVALGGPALILKLRRNPGQPLDAAAQAAWWQVNGRYRAIEPMLNAISSLPNGPRLDLAHILPRLPRSLLNSFPPDFANADDAGVESSVMASDFFSLAPGADPRTEGALREWLAREAVPAAGPFQYGDLLVYGDLDANPWPYTVVYLAGQTGFARRPTAFGPWQFIDLAEIGRLNPRFAGKTPRVYRSKGALTPPGEPPYLPGRMPAAWRQRLSLKSVQPGPWGRLWYFDVLLAPAGDILEQLPAPDPHPRWIFQGLSRDQLLQATDTVVMPEQTRTALRTLFTAARPDADGRIAVEPPLDLVLAVPSAFRTATFSHLVGGLSVTDYAQHIPFPKGFTVGEWFEAGSLPETVRQAILRLVYPSGDRVMLSDFGALYQLLDTKAEQLSAHRAALRQPALVVLLERPDPAEVPGIAAYWTYGRDKSVRRLLESFAADPGQRFLDIVHLLSPVERELINTYFTPAGPEPAPSCFWTAFNFGADRPDDRFLVIPGIWTEQRELAGQELAQKYDPLPAPGRLGDIIGYRRKGAAAFDHVCVFLADDLVFTKNGFTFSSPWVISRLAELDEQYLTTPEMERLYFRRRTLPAAPPAP
jgi:hypothetical protein